MILEAPPAPDLVIAEVQRRGRTRQQHAQTFLALRKRHGGNRGAIEVKQIEKEKDESAAVTGV